MSGAGTRKTGAWWVNEEEWSIVFPTDEQVKAGLPDETIFVHGGFIWVVLQPRVCTVIGLWENNEAHRLTREQADELQRRAS